ncbi:hypothetical protein RJ639_040084 [Escallonia herrerae]|uniref:Small auxin up regulated protein n=1 Tax=Escallonia herrerae TaxID=1293975 RepID=A0AA88WKT1_9ASTE|nr:hypothetical protein RJ639_040084 [Escallonia herrerae]
MGIRLPSLLANAKQIPTIMGFRLPSMLLQAKQILKQQSLSKSQFLSSTTLADVPKGYFAVYVGDVRKRRFVVPVSYLNHPSFQGLLNQAEEEFGFHHPTGDLTIPCKEEVFIDLTARLNAS